MSNQSSSKRSNKYNEITIAAICETLELTGSDYAAWNAGSISKATYYSWAKEREEFKFKLIKAKAKFLRRNQGIFKDLALNSMYKTLVEGQVQRWHTTIKERDENGNLVVTSVKENEVHKGVPQWLIDRVLGKPMEELEAVTRLVEGNWFNEEAVTEISSSSEKFTQEVRQILTKNSMVETKKSMVEIEAISRLIEAGWLKEEIVAEISSSSENFLQAIQQLLAGNSNNGDRENI